MKQGPIERLLSHVRDFGLAGLHLRVLAGLNLYRELSIFALDLQHHRPGQKARISIAISETVPNEGLQPHSGASCFIASHNGQIVSRLTRTVNTCRLDYIDEELHLAHNECYLHAAFTEAAYRGQGILGELISCACNSIPHTRALVAIAGYNQFSNRAFAKAGFKLKEVRGYYGFWRWRHHFCVQPSQAGSSRCESA